MFRSITAVALILSGTAVFAENPDAFDAVKIDAGRTLFEAECRRCHAPEATDVSYGPSLENILGRTAGTVEGFDYSDALASAGFVWTKGALKAWMEDNDGFLPGTRMRHVGIVDPTAQDFVLSYLVSLSE